MPIPFGKRACAVNYMFLNHKPTCYVPILMKYQPLICLSPGAPSVEHQIGCPHIAQRLFKPSLTSALPPLLSFQIAPYCSKASPHMILKSIDIKNCNARTMVCHVYSTSKLVPIKKHGQHTCCFRHCSIHSQYEMHIS